MNAQIKFDLKKNLWSSFTVVIFLTFFLLLMTNFFSNLGTLPNYTAEIHDAYDDVSTDIQNELKVLRKDKHPDKHTQAMLARDQDQYLHISAIIMAYVGEQPAEINQVLLDYAQYNLKETQAVRAKTIRLVNYPGKETDYSLLGRKKDVFFYQYLLKHRLTEIPVIQENAPATNYLSYALIYRLAPILVLFVFAIQLAQIFTVEQQEGNLDFLNTVPANPLKTLTSKIGTFLLITPILLLLAGVVCFVIVGWKYGFGMWQYPLVYSLDGKQVEVLMLGKALILYVSFLLLVLIFLAVLSALISLFSHNFGVVLTVIGGVILLSEPAVLTSGTLKAVTKFLPIAYFDLPKIVLHQTTWSIASLPVGAVVLLGWSAVLYGLAALVIRKKQML
ncbi:ABC transporter permease [Lapidilactobacillus bayanensis]|uniref:ABC transporter permease n=1 Tax=Lapidilactobacillus bayanensis TaxID=2485998 RepID=UPI000F7B4E44|nr:ABC transporter permease [Lapidilactobacillus bayanensis]